jgi:hypothetical protein
MNRYQPDSWGRQLGRGALLLLVVAGAARLAADLLAPLVPAMLALLLLAGVLVLVSGIQQRRW